MQHDDLTGSSNNNVHSKASLKCNMMTGSWICTVQSKISSKRQQGAGIIE
jgi:hypothetical protein